MADVPGIRDAVLGLAELGKQSVSQTRSAFAAGIVPLQTVGSGSVSHFIGTFGEGTGSAIIRGVPRLGVSTANSAAQIDIPKPEVDFVSVFFDPRVGCLDSAAARIRVSLPIESVDPQAFIRIYRAFHGSSSVPAASPSAMIDGFPAGMRTKGSDPLAVFGFRAADIGSGNQLAQFVVDDGFSSQRSVVSLSELRPVPPVPNTNRNSAVPAGLVSISNLDRSVAEDTAFYINLRSSFRQVPPSIPLSVGSRQGINVMEGTSVGSSLTDLLGGENVPGFSSVAQLSLSSTRQVGGFAVVDYVDPSVVYGASYSYYACLLTKLELFGPRSRIVRVTVASIVPPHRADCLFSVVAGRPRFSLRCSGTFVDHVEVFRRGIDPRSSSRVIGSDEGLVVEKQNASTDAGFFHITDLSLGNDRSVTFEDGDVTSGQKLSYRFYTVDSFGVKCQTPFSCSLVIPEHGFRVPQQLPVVTIEQGQDPRSVKIGMNSDSERTVGFIVDRSEEGISIQHSIPTGPSYFTLGSSTPKRSQSRQGPKLSVDSDGAWVGTLVAFSGSASFIDRTVCFDRTYRYGVRTVDVRGNIGPRFRSAPMTVRLKTVVPAPISLSASVIVDDSTGEGKVRLSWTAGTNDFTAVDLMGNQSVLADNSVRSVFQVERREVGTIKWEFMPATSGTHFDDSVSTGMPDILFRPLGVEVNHEYEYRVIALQSGGLISLYSDPVDVVVSPDMLGVGPLRVRSSSTAVRPLLVVVSWQYDGTSVDSWEIERATTNKIFGSKVLSMDSREARELRYSWVAEVSRESSRARPVFRDDMALDRSLFVGNRAFVDADISLANSYFYRVRSKTTMGAVSSWSYAGINLVDSPFDRKFFSALSDEQKSSMANDPRPAVWGDEDG